VSGRTVADGLRLAVGTLTSLRVPPPSRVDAAVGRAGMLAAPLAGLLLAAPAAAVVAVGGPAELPPLVVAVLALGAVALGSRGLHLDGLADTADGLAASYDRARALEVMRRGDVGPAGAAALVLVLLLQAGALAAGVSAGHGVLAVAVALLAGRAVLPLVCARPVPAARADGLGTGVASTVPVPAAAATCGAVLLAVSLGGAAAGLPPWQAPLAALVGWLVAAALVLRCVRRLGGVTGDVMGAAVEVATAGALVVLGVG
jgi:adenosylcobinamide-GDP ribazoletransferase